MLKHTYSFLRNPLGYIANFTATMFASFGWDRIGWVDSILASSCERLCSHDGIQNDWHPLFK